MFPSPNSSPPPFCPNANPQFPQHPPVFTPPMYSQSTSCTPLYFIPMPSAPFNAKEAVVVDLTKRHGPTGVQCIAPKTVVQPSSPRDEAKYRKPLPSIDDRELKRRVKKQNMERRRRACISDKLSALHNLAVSLVGEKPQPQYQRTEITDVLNQCVNVFQGLSEFVKKEPELQAKMRGLRNLLTNERTSMPEGEKENVTTAATPRTSAFTKVGVQNPLASTPLAPRVNPLREHGFNSSACLHSQKRQSSDSGCGNSLSSHSDSSVHNPSYSQNAGNVPSKRRRQSGLWRPYLD